MLWKFHGYSTRRGKDAAKKQIFNISLVCEWPYRTMTRRGGKGHSISRYIVQGWELVSKPAISLDKRLWRLPRGYHRRITLLLLFSTVFSTNNDSWLEMAAKKAIWLCVIYTTVDHQVPGTQPSYVLWPVYFKALLTATVLYQAWCYLSIYAVSACTYVLPEIICYVHSIIEYRWLRLTLLLLL